MKFEPISKDNVKDSSFPRLRVGAGAGETGGGDYLILRIRVSTPKEALLPHKKGKNQKIASSPKDEYLRVKRYRVWDLSMF